jgi:hypothetical protein
LIDGDLVMFRTGDSLLSDVALERKQDLLVTLLGDGGARGFGDGKDFPTFTPAPELLGGPRLSRDFRRMSGELRGGERPACACGRAPLS